MSEPLVGTPTTIGDVQITPVLDGFGRAPVERFFAAPDGTDVAGTFALPDHERWIDHDGMLQLPIAAFVVRAAGRTALIDLGAGPVQVMGFEGGQMLDALAAAGVAVDDVDTILLSHLHFDHVGWATRAVGNGDDERREITFPNATIRCATADWHHFVDEEQAPRGVLHRLLRPIEARVEPCGDGDEVFPGVTVRATPGHTPGHNAFVIASGGERALLLGDAVHCPIQIEYAEWEVMGDVDPKLATRTRLALLAELDGNTRVGAPHFPGLEFGRVLQGKGKRYWA